jgi:CRP/FNR family cyclic AMP-dependent transcriptional regulator
MSDEAEVAEIEIRAGHILFREGDKPDKAYIVRRGTLEVSKQKRGQKVVLGLAGVSDIVGEMALIVDAPRMATVTALDDAKLIAVTKQEFLSKISGTDRVTRHLLNKFIGIIRRTADELGDELTKFK